MASFTLFHIEQTLPLSMRRGSSRRMNSREQVSNTKFVKKALDGMHDAYCCERPGKPRHPSRVNEKLASSTVLPSHTSDRH